MSECRFDTVILSDTQCTVVANRIILFVCFFFALWEFDFNRLGLMFGSVHRKL